MIVAAAKEGYWLQFKGGSFIETTDDHGRTIRKAVKSKVIKFKPFHQNQRGIPTNAIPTHYLTPGFARSRMDTEEWAPKLGVTVEELDRWIVTHPSHGRAFIRVDEDTTDAVGDAGAGDGIVPVGDGSYSCTICNKLLRDGRGLTGHKRSNKHIQALERLREDMELSAAV